MGILIKAKEIYGELMKYYWFFELEDGKIIKIVFNEEHFTHLIFGTKINDSLAKFKGKNGYLEILKVDFSMIEEEVKLNPKISSELTNIRNRITYFEELENILKNPNYFFYDTKKVVAKNKNDISAEYYFGVSCIIDNASFKHTCNQDKVRVIKSWIKHRT